MPTDTPRNHAPATGGKVAAVCQFCARRARPTKPNDNCEPDLWTMVCGWSEAPFPAGHQHADGSTGSRYTCPACNAQLRAGRTLQTCSGQASRLVL